MIRTIEVEIDEAGVIRPLDATMTLPQGKAVLYWPEDDDTRHPLMSGKSFEDWLLPEEDEAWAYLQPKR